MAHDTLTDLHELCSDPEANPLRVAVALDQATQFEWQDWDPEMLRDFTKLGDDSVAQLDKIMAIQVAKTNPDVFNDWHLFHHVCTALNHRRAHFEWAEPLDIPELAWGCKALRLLNIQEDFSAGVERYIGTTCIIQGLIFFPWVGGKGMHLCEPPHDEWTKGIVDPDLCAVGSEVRERWARGELKDLEFDEGGEDDNPLHVQIQLIVASQDYIRQQQSKD